MGKSLSKKAVMAKGALMAVLAADSAIDLNSILAGVKKSNWLAKKPGIVAAIKPLLAADADIADIVQLLDKLDGESNDDDNIATDEPDPKCEAILSMLRGKISDEDLAQVQAALSAPAAAPAAADEPVQTPGAANADPKNGEGKAPIPGATDGNEEVKDKPMDKAAMDKAIKLAVDAARKETAKDVEASTIARLRGISEAEEIVKPYVGKLVAMDSAEAVYKAALGALKIDTKDLHPSAYKAVLMAQPKPGEERKSHMASDSAGVVSSDFAEAFPSAGRLAS